VFTFAQEAGSVGWKGPLYHKGVRVWREAWGRCTVKVDLMKVIGWNGG